MKVRRKPIQAKFICRISVQYLSITAIHILHPFLQLVLRYAEKIDTYAEKMSIPESVL